MQCRLTQVLEVEEEVAIVSSHPVACTAEVLAVFIGMLANSKPVGAQTWYKPGGGGQYQPTDVQWASSYPLWLAD